MRIGITSEISYLSALSTIELRCQFTKSRLEVSGEVRMNRWPHQNRLKEFAVHLLVHFSHKLNVFGIIRSFEWLLLIGRGTSVMIEKPWMGLHTHESARSLSIQAMEVEIAS